MSQDILKCHETKTTRSKYKQYITETISQFKHMYTGTKGTNKNLVYAQTLRITTFWKCLKLLFFDNFYHPILHKIYTTLM